MQLLLVLLLVVQARPCHHLLRVVLRALQTLQNLRTPRHHLPLVVHRVLLLSLHRLVVHYCLEGGLLQLESFLCSEKGRP
jgi:hypothetical protein